MIRGRKTQRQPTNLLTSTVTSVCQFLKNTGHRGKLANENCAKTHPLAEIIDLTIRRAQLQRHRYLP